MPRRRCSPVLTAATPRADRCGRARNTRQPLEQASDPTTPHPTTSTPTLTSIVQAHRDAASPRRGTCLQQATATYLSIIYDDDDSLDNKMEQLQ